MTNIEQFFEKHGIVERVEPPPAGAPDILPLTWFKDIGASLNAADFVEGMLCDGAMSVTYGESNSGKTFLASDLGMRVSLGWDWHGRETEQRGVLYLACEGSGGIFNRIAAFRQAHEIEGEPPFAVVPASVNLKDHDGDTAKVVRTADAMKQATGIDVGLIVVDTLSRAMAGGEENSSQDMGAVVRHCDEIRHATGAHVLIVHHSGKDTARGARGHSLLRAATDTEIEVVRAEGSDAATATVRKQRDLPGGHVIGFRLESVELGTDRRGNAVTSCVVVSTEPPKSAARVKLSDEQKAFMDDLREALQTAERVIPIDGMPAVPAVKRNHLRNHLVESGFLDSATPQNNQRATVSKYLSKLKGKGLLGLTKEYVWLT